MRGEGPDPVLVLAAVRALPDTSLTAALAAGGRDHYGWGVDRHMGAAIYDALMLLIRAAGHWGKKGPPKLPEYPRPKSKPRKSEAPKVTVLDVFRRLTGRG